MSGVLAGIGGALAALAVQHVDPQMAYWTTSGGFVFVTILAGAGSVAAAFVGSLLFELVRSIAVDAGARRMADDSRHGAAAHHPVPARGPRLAGRAACGDKKGTARERDPLGARPGEDLRLGGRRARHLGRRAGAADRRHHRREWRRQDHLRQHDHRPPLAVERLDPVRGQGHHRHAVARHHAARHLALVPGRAGVPVA